MELRALISVSAPWRRHCVLDQASMRKFRKFLITSDKNAVNVEELAALLTATGQNCHQFPLVSKEGIIPRVNTLKLKKAIKFSDIIIAVYNRGRYIPGGDYMERTWEHSENEGVLGHLLPWNSPKCLIAFGRAVSDKTMAASVHDLAVAPAMQTQGIGQFILQRLTWYLYYQQGIPDISVLTGPQNLSFFTKCGFKPDELCSTTMLYTKPAVHFHDDIKHVGRLSVRIPTLSMKMNFTKF